MAWIAGERVILRAWERDDIRLRWEADQTADAEEAKLRHWHEPPQSLAEREAEFDAAASAEKDPTSLSFIVEAEGRPIGDINLFHIDQRNRQASVGISLWRPQDRGQGYGSDAMRAVLRWAFDQMNLHRIELSVAPYNDAAVAVYRKLGFVDEGRRREAHFEDGAYVDDVLMGLLAREFRQRDAGAAP